MAVGKDAEKMLKEKENSRQVHPRRPLCACTGYSCNKLFLLLYACLYLVIGVAVMLLGVWVELDNKDFDVVNNDLFIPAILLISAGGIIGIGAIFGITGVLQENICLLRTFLVLTVTAFLTQIAIGVLAFIYKQEVPDLVSSNLMFLVKGYSSNPSYRMALGNMQSRLSCCGLESFADYEENEHFACGSGELQACGVPWTCCHNQTRGSPVKIDCGFGVRWNSTMPVDVIWTSGCTDKFLKWLGQRLDWVGVVGLGSAIPQVIGILLVYYLIRQVRELKMWYRVGL